MTAEREGLAEIAGVLAEHVTVGGTYWDHERKTTYAKCQCGAPCYLVGQHEQRHAQHLAEALADLLAARDRRVRGEALREAARAWQIQPNPLAGCHGWLMRRAHRIEADR